MTRANEVLLILAIATAPILNVAAFPKVTIGNAKIDDAVARKVRPFFDDDDGRPVRSIAIDLNGDGVPEKFIPNEFLCGNGGCPWLIYDQKNDQVIGELFGSSVDVKEKSENGYSVLEVYGSHGSAGGEIRIYQFFDGRYRVVHINRW